MITPLELKLHAKWNNSEPDGVRLVKVNADFRDADFRDADFRDADFRCADFCGASLNGANFDGADLAGASFDGACLIGASFCGANLIGASFCGANLGGASLGGASLGGANFDEADLSGARFGGVIVSSGALIGANIGGTNLRRANLSGATGLPIAADAAERLKAVAAAALQPDALDMRAWHTCNTKHCMGGWAIHQAGEPGRLLEVMLGPQVAGLLLLGVEAHQHFYDSDEDALEYLRGVAGDV